MIADEYVQAKKFWIQYGEILKEYLCDNCFPLFTCKSTRTDGISICKVKYYGKKGNIKTKWLKDKPLKKKLQLIVSCEWTFRPLFIKPRKMNILPENQSYWYLVYILQKDGEGHSVSYISKISTTINGALLQKRYINVDGNINSEEKQMKPTFAFPKQLVSKINRCLANYFFLTLWIGPPCAAWHRINGEIAYYLGIPERLKTQPTLELINGQNGTVISVLLAYSCFSVLKSFFPTYHVLQKNTAYFEAKANIPKQISINVQSSNLDYAEQLVHMCCGYFQSFTSNGIPIIDGILVQKSHSVIKELSITEFEKKILQPACVLWVNRNPENELIQSGKILNLQVSSQPEINSDISLSEYLTFMLAKKMESKTKTVFFKCLIADWKESIPNITAFLLSSEKKSQTKGYSFSVDNIDIQAELARINKLEAKLVDPIYLLDYLNLCIKIDILEAMQGRTVEKQTPLKELYEEIRKEYRKASNEIHKIHRKNMRSLFSLDSTYQKTMDRLMKNESVYVIDKNIIEKIAYLSTSFQVFAYTMEQLEDVRNMLCNRVEEAIIDVFINQIGRQIPRNVIEKYILSLLKEGQCARIRGKYSDQNNIHIWYDPKEGTFLLPSKRYFDALNHYTNISKKDFEDELVKAGVLCTVQRKKQMRRTFEVVVEKGGCKMSVLKINTASLSDLFKKDVREYLEQIDNDKTPYRS